VYAFTLQPVTDALGLTDEQTLHRFKTVVTALVPILALAGRSPSSPSTTRSPASRSS
jgi:hypothetical protein